MCQDDEKPANTRARGHSSAQGEDKPMIVTPAFMLTNAHDRIVHTKAIRRLANYLAVSFGDKELTALSIVSLWCSLNRLEGGPMSKIIDWSGYRSNWKFRVKTGIQACLKLDMLELVRVSGGQRLCVTGKGQRVLDVYDIMTDRVREEFNAVYIASKLRIEAELLKDLEKRLKTA